MGLQPKYVIYADVEVQLSIFLAQSASLYVVKHGVPIFYVNTMEDDFLKYFRSPLVAIQ